MHRCTRLVRDLDGSIDWLLPSEPGRDFRSRAEMHAYLDTSTLPVRWLDHPDGPYDLVILDKRESDRAEIESLGINGIVVGIDIVGEARSYCSFVIDTLPTPPGASLPNIADPGLLYLPDRVRDDWPSQVRHVLVAFGGESAGETAVAAGEYLTAETGLSVTAAVREELPGHRSVSQLVAAGTLQEHLAQFDLVITHFGLTAYEALWARVPVLCINPGGYHDRLSDIAGFVRTERIESVPKLLVRYERVVKRSREIRPAGRSDLAQLLNSLVPPRRLNSPTGGERLQPAVERYAERTFFRNGAGLVYQQNYRGIEVLYNRDYFFREYRDQYGRTYLEDFDAIATVGRRRLLDIRKVRGSRGVSANLLDIGCAYGPFLKSARDEGFRVHGIDVSCDAVEHVRQALGIDATCGDIREISLEGIGAPFDVVTMWYVIEHFEDLDTFLQAVRSLMKPGAILAFSTPNGNGISARSDRREFFRRSPDDHYTIWDSRSAGTTLEAFGFRVRRIRVTGHHPERFHVPVLSSSATRSGTIRSLIGAWSRLRGLGDTFEVIAEMVR